MALVVIPYTFTVGAVIIAAQHNSNFSTIYNDYNGNIQDVNLASNAAIEYSKLALNNSIRNSDILSTTVFNIGNIPTLSYSNITQFPYVKVSEQQTSGTSAGTATSGSWITRVLNHTDADTSSISSLASNQVTLPAGTYRVSVSAPFIVQQFAKLRLYNITASAELIPGQTTFIGANTGPVASGGIALLSGEFTIAVSSAIAVQYQVTVTQTTDGLGSASGFETEVYTVAEFTKVA